MSTKGFINKAKSGSVAATARKRQAVEQARLRKERIRRPLEAGKKTRIEIEKPARAESGRPPEA